MSEGKEISVDEYPREVVCEECNRVVAFARSSAQTGGLIIASEVILPDGTHPEDHVDPVCPDCVGSMSFTVRDRVEEEKGES